MNISEEEMDIIEDTLEGSLYFKDSGITVNLWTFNLDYRKKILEKVKKRSELNDQDILMITSMLWGSKYLKHPYFVTKIWKYDLEARKCVYNKLHEYLYPQRTYRFKW